MRIEWIPSGLDYFGARYNSSAQGRFTSPDPKSAGASVGNPQSWDGYSYALNNPMAYVDPNGKWPTWIHSDIYRETFAGVLSGSQIKEIMTVSEQQDSFLTGGQDPGNSYTHSMCFPGQAAGPCSAIVNGYVNSQLAQANELSSGGRELTSGSIAFFARAGHSLTDKGSPVHTGPDGLPLPWGAGTAEGIAHFLSEQGDTGANLFYVGQSIRFLIDGFVRAFPELAKKQGRPGDWADRVINRYVDNLQAGTGHGTSNSFTTGGHGQEDADRQCALGNPAACR